VSVDTPKQASFQNISQPGTVTESVFHLNKVFSSPSTIKTSQKSGLWHSYQDTKNQLNAGRSEAWSVKQNNNYIIKPDVTCPAMSNTARLMSQKCNEHDNSTEKDLVYMKPGSYKASMRGNAPINNRNTDPVIIYSNVNNSLKPVSAATAAVPISAAPNVPPPSHHVQMGPSILRDTHMSKSQESPTLFLPAVSQNNNSDTSDLVWRNAYASAETLRET
jgi:hypothetical protein